MVTELGWDDTPASSDISEGRAAGLRPRGEQRQPVQSEEEVSGSRDSESQDPEEGGSGAQARLSLPGCIRKPALS